MRVWIKRGVNICLSRIACLAAGAFNFFVNSFWFGTILSQLFCWILSRYLANLPLNWTSLFISFNQQKLHIPLLNSDTPNLMASFAFFGIAFPSLPWVKKREPNTYRRLTGFVSFLLWRHSGSFKVDWLLPLPCARKEADVVGRLVGVPPLVDEKATKQAVLERISSVSLIHIAAYGNAERGEIALSPFLLPTVETPSHHRKLTCWQWPMSHKWESEPNWWYLAAVTVEVET